MSGRRIAVALAVAAGLVVCAVLASSGRGSRAASRELALTSISARVSGTDAHAGSLQDRLARRYVAVGHHGHTAGLVRLAGELPPGLSADVAGGRIRSEANAAARSGRRLSIEVVLRRSDEAGFRRYLNAVRDRSSPLYGRFLSPAQQAAHFGPSRASYEQMKAWLRERGLDVTGGSANRLSLTARGTMMAAEKAFDATIRDFRVGSRSVYANTQAPAVPAQLASHVQAVTGLDDLSAPLGPPAPAPSDQHLCEHSGSLAETPGNKKFKESCANLCRANAEKALPKSFLETVYELLLLALPPVFSVANTAVNGGNSTWGFIGYCIGASLTESNPEFGNWFSEHRPEIEEFKKHFKEGAFQARRANAPVSAARASSGASHLVARDARDVSPQISTTLGPIQKIGLLEYDTFNPTDVTDWLNLEGIEPGLLNQLSEVNVNGGVTSPGAGESEVLLDIDTVIGAAPFAQYVVYDAPADTSFVQIFQTMIAGGDNVISNSWSQCEDQTPIAEAQAVDSVLASATASGITVLNGTGDGGSSCLDGSPDTIGVPADSPNATAVGGTSPTFGPGLSYGSESWWDERKAAPEGGAGGYGVSRYFARPAYQDGHTSSSMRSVPDLSFVADPHAGVTLCQADAGGCPDGQQWGGTSMSVPAVAGLVADLNEQLGHNVGDLNTALYPLAETGAFHSAASMESDFAHVGLGSPVFGAVYRALSGTTVGAVSATVSTAGGVGHPQADGLETGLVRVNLKDGNGAPIAGKQVTLTPDAGSKATISASTTTDANGVAVFTVTDATVQSITFTVTDVSDGVALKTQPTLSFGAPTATGSSILATPHTVANDGSSQATISVYLQDGLGRPAAGKTVKLAGGGSAEISPGSNEAVTDSEGVATFTATDSEQESIGFTATDVTDKNLPIPGTALVNFQPASAAPCKDTAPVLPDSSAIAISPFVSGLPDNSQEYESYYEGIRFIIHSCHGNSPPAFDSSGNVFVADSVSNEVYEFGPGGGIAGTGDALPDSVPGVQALAFGKHGELYATLNKEGNLNQPELVELDRATGAIDRVIATKAAGLYDFPTYLAVDPISGDVFVVDDGGGAGTEHFSVVRVAHPDSSTPTVSDYANVEGVQAGVTFAPDGTMYVAVLTEAHKFSIVSVSATNSGAPGTVSPVVTLPMNPFGVAVAESDSQGHATALDVVDDEGSIYRVDLVDQPATVQKQATGDVFSPGAAIGLDGCLYYSEEDLLLKVTGVDSKCASSPTSTGPQLTLNGSALSSPATGSPVTFEATLSGVQPPQGTPIHFLVTGANSQMKLVDASAAGSASFTYAGTFAGADTVTAIAVVGGKQIESAPITFRWIAGKDTSYLSLNAGQGGGALGQPATLRASLFDVSVEPAAPIAGASVTLSLAGQSCTASTDSAGEVSCSVTPTGGPGLDGVTASYAGGATYTASTATNVFEAGVGLEQPPGPAPGPSSSSTGAASAAAPIEPAIGKRSPPPVPPLAEVLGLPSARECVSGRKLVVHVHAPAGEKLLGVRLTLGRKVLRSVKFTKSGHHRLPSTVVDLVGLPKGTFTLKIVVMTKSGKTYTATRTYHTCVAGKKPPAKKPKR